MQRSIRMIIENRELVALPATRSTAGEAARLMRKNHAGAVLVTKNGHLVGIFTERDALFRVLAEGHDANVIPLADVMTPSPQAVHPDKPITHALHMLYEGGYRHLPIVDGWRAIGMVSARDALGSELEIFVSELKRRDHIAEILA